MALNRYSKLPKATIRNTQVLTDLGIIDTALQRKQAKYDAQANFNAQAIQGAETLPVFGEYDTAYKNKVAADIKNKVAEVSNMDLADPNVSGGVNQFIQQMSSDPRLAQAVQAKSMYDEFQNTRKELAAKGKLPTSAEILRQKAWNDYSKTGQLTEDATEPLYEAQDLIKGRGDLVSMIKASGTDIIAALSDGTAYKNSSKGVAADRIRKAVEAQLPTYMNSAYGKQELDDYKVAKMSGSIPKDMSFGDYLTKQVMSTAANYSYSDFSTNRDSAMNQARDRADRLAKEKEEKDGYAGEGYLPAMAMNKKVELDSDGRININPALDLWDWMSNSDSRSKEDLALEKTLQEGAKRSGMDIKTYAEKLNSDPNVKVSYYNADKAKKISTQFYNPSTGGGTFWTMQVKNAEFPDGISAKELMEEKGLKKEDLDKGFTVIGDVSPDNPYTPKGMGVMIGGEYYILDDRHSLKDPKALVQHEANQAKYKGDGGTHTTELYNPADKRTYSVTYVYDASTDEVKEDTSLRKVIK